MWNGDGVVPRSNEGVELGYAGTRKIMALRKEDMAV